MNGRRQTLAAMAAMAAIGMDFGAPVQRSWFARGRRSSPPASRWPGDGSASVETRQSRRRDARTKVKRAKRRCALEGGTCRFRGTAAQMRLLAEGGAHAT